MLGPVPVALVGVVLSSLVHAAYFRFVCDDAFISFRYVDNLLVRGELTYNPGIRVEGYSNLLRVIQLALLGSVGVDPVTASQLLDAAYSVARCRIRSVAMAAVPVAAVFLLHTAFRWIYDGDPLPNTFHAKVNAPWWSMGFAWEARALIELGAWWPLALVLLAVVFVHRGAQLRKLALLSPDPAWASRSFCLRPVVLGGIRP